ncbi:response regulator transcription factor [Allocatelliglobosispora scoriae]|nr:response regulator transcription factor [Allocatelliglobosispora scoriae]
MRVVIAEDMVLLRDGIARMLTADGIDVVAQVGDVAALLSAVDEHRPDLAVIDIRMPPTFTDEGARAALRLRDTHPDLAILVLSNIVEPELALTLATEHPARFGYLLKDRVLDTADFLQTLRRVAEGGTAIDASIIDRLMGTAGNSRLNSLSAREREVLSWLAQGLTNAAIGRRLHVSERTVDAHLRSVFVKLDLAPSADENRRVRAALSWLGQDGTRDPVAS